MPKKSIQPGEPVPLKLTVTERKALLDLACLDEECEAAIQDTSTGKAVMMSLEDLENLADYLAAEANHTKDAKLQKKLDGICNKIERVLDTYDDEPEAERNLPDMLMRVSRDDGEGPDIFPIRPMKKSPKLSLKLTELQREAVIHATRLRQALKKRLREAGCGTQTIEFTRKELDEVQSEVGEAAYYAPSPEKKRLQAVISKVTDAFDADILEQYGIEKTGNSHKTSSKNTVFQLKISLDGIEPSIWRRVQVKDCTLGKLHDVIQAAMGWDNYHMWAFEIAGDRYSHPQAIGDLDWKNAQKMKLSQVVNDGHNKFGYIYDMGDNWDHSIVIEKAIEPELKAKYPRCLAGARACPPEDCGGIWGYEEFLETVQNPKHEEHEEMLEWVGGEFDAEEFDPKAVTKRMRK